MSPMATSLIVLLSIFACAVIGVFLRNRFPSEHLSSDTKDVVKLVMGTVGTMTGMVLGLLVGAAKSSFDGQQNGVAQLSSSIVVLDRTLEHYGPEAKDARASLRESADDMIRRMWPEEQSAAEQPASGSSHDGRYDALYDRILALQPKNDAQRTIHAQAMKIMHDTTQMRWQLFAQRSNTIPPAFLVLMVAWLSITFASYGLFAPRHATTFAVLFLGASVVSSAVFLILELDHAFGGLIHVSSQPMRNAMSLLGKL